jgi:hypothetical protein
MAARGLISPVLMIVSMALEAESASHVADPNKLYFTQFQDGSCTGTGTIGEIRTGSEPRTGVMTEFEWDVTPTSSVTGCSGKLKCKIKGGSACDFKYYSLSMTCGSGNGNISIQTFRASASDIDNHCKAGNEYYKYDIMSSEFSNVRAGSCTNATYSTSPTASTSSNRSLKLSGGANLLCGLCGGSCSTVTNATTNATTNAATNAAPTIGATSPGSASGASALLGMGAMSTIILVTALHCMA